MSLYVEKRMQEVLDSAPAYMRPQVKPLIDGMVDILGQMAADMADMNDRLVMCERLADNTAAIVAGDAE